MTWHGTRVAFVSGLACGALSLWGCALTTRPFSTPLPGEVSGLEDAVLQDPTNVDAVVALAAGYVAQGSPMAASDLLQETRQRLPAEPTLLLLQGLIQQELQLYEQAARAFIGYLDMMEGPLKEDVVARLNAVRVPAVRAAVRRLVTEDSMPTAAANSEAVAVMPFSISGADTELATALEWLVHRHMSNRGVATTERVVLLSLLDAMGVASTRPSDLAVGLDVARLLGVGHVVQGEVLLRSDSLYWTLRVLTPLSDGRTVVSALPSLGTLDELPTMVASVATLASEAVERSGDFALDPVVDVPPPTGVPALRAFASGLLAFESGEWTSARADFERASDLDEAFDEASEWAERTLAVIRATDQDLLAFLETAARVGERQRSVAALRATSESAPERPLARGGAEARAELSEVLGLDVLGGGTLLGVTLEVPGPGGPP